MKNISEYKKRFYTLLESTIGDVKPLLIEVEEPIKTGNQSQNGNLPSEKVVSTDDGSGSYLGSDAADKYKKMVEDAKKEKVVVRLTGKDSGYRVCGSPGDWLGGDRCKNGIFSQWCAHEKDLAGVGNDAAVPIYDKTKKWWKCISNHGWGRAIDVSQGISWVRKNGEKYGFCWGEKENENWHFTYCGPGENRSSMCDTKCNDPNNKKVPQTPQTLKSSEFKKIWEDKIEKEIKNGFTTKDPTISRPDLIKIDQFEDADLTLEYEYLEYAEIKFVGDGTNGVSIIALGVRKIDEENPSMFFIDVYKSDKNNMSVGERKRFGDLETQSIDTLETAAVQAKNYFFDLCKQFEEYPYSKEGPKEFENQNSFDI